MAKYKQKKLLQIWKSGTFNSKVLNIFFLKAQRRARASVGDFSWCNPRVISENPRVYVAQKLSTSLSMLWIFKIAHWTTRLDDRKRAFVPLGLEAKPQPPTSIHPTLYRTFSVDFLWLFFMLIVARIIVSLFWTPSSCFNWTPNQTNDLLGLKNLGLGE